jgi:hypothetical protein
MKTWFKIIALNPEAQQKAQEGMHAQLVAKLY